MTNLLVMLKIDLKKLRAKSQKCLPKLDSRPKRFHSFLCLDGKEITSLKKPQTWTGTKDSKSNQRKKKLKDGLFLMLLTMSSPSQKDQPRSHSECLSLVSTKSKVLVMSSLDVSNKVP